MRLLIPFGGTIKAQPPGDLASTERTARAPVFYFGQGNWHWQVGRREEGLTREGLSLSLLKLTRGVLVSLSCCNKTPHTERLKQQKLIVSQSEAKVQAQGQQGSAPSEDFFQLLTAAGIPWLIDISCPSLPLWTHGLLPVCLCLRPGFLPLIRTPRWH